MKKNSTNSTDSKEFLSVADNLDVIIRLLRVMIRLNLDQQIMEKKLKRKDQLLLMDSAGLTTADIASILGQASKDVSSAIKNAKRDKKPKKNNDDKDE